MKVKATYVGLRRFSESTMSAAFLVGGSDEEKDLRYFKHVKYGEIGREYWLEQKGKNYACGRFPEAVDEDLVVQKTPHIKRWAAQEFKDEKQVRRIRTAKKLAKDPELATIVRRLESYCVGLSYFEIKEVIEHCISEIGLKLRKVKIK